MSRLSVKEAADYVPCHKSTLDKLRSIGGGPKFIKLGKRVLYDTRDLDLWLEDQKRDSTADLGAGGAAPDAEGEGDARCLQTKASNTAHTRGTPWWGERPSDICILASTSNCKVVKRVLA
jgi:hypothetical protein